MDKTDFCSPRLAKMLFYPYLGTFGLGWGGGGGGGRERKGGMEKRGKSRMRGKGTGTGKESMIYRKPTGERAYGWEMQEERERERERERGGGRAVFTYKN